MDGGTNLMRRSAAVLVCAILVFGGAMAGRVPAVLEKR